ncbi:DUF3307 domain-containing protein [Rhizosphaericola mali]|uniref:DUF3307 domain-containing protein n=1 Tax=Rhizosphaericola mali TaxID=2545455 RepID=A0A5P2G427_9BACT|nr:DUF3307 domain-containing protein [Rhizosphaericola mali]QES90586.1 DUF3307 domain-containing protein [Rhizosphaericola mali]
MNLLLRLLLAHFLGDFLFQPNKWVKDKCIHKEKSPFLYAHLGVHAILLLILLQGQHLLAILFILITHFIIDWLKLKFSTEKNQRRYFFYDQFAHVLILLLVTNHFVPGFITTDKLLSDHGLVIVITVLFATVVSSIIMKTLIGRWDMTQIDSPENSLKDAGLYIGILERMFIVGFILLNYWAGVGFLITIKSVYRFNDLSKAKDRKLTEYIMIGTLISFGLGIVAGLFCKYLS